MNRKVAFIGHRQNLPEDIEERVFQAVKNEIALGCNSFIMGTHGDFDKVALQVCEKIRNSNDINIEVVITSLAQIKPIITQDAFGIYKEYPYDNVKTIMFEIEECYFKRRITESNKKMIDCCDTLICYVNKQKGSSGAKTAMNYAIKRDLKVNNLFAIEDTPFYGMTEEEKDVLWQKMLKNSRNWSDRKVETNQYKEQCIINKDNYYICIYIISVNNIFKPTTQAK